MARLDHLMIALDSAVVAPAVLEVSAALVRSRRMELHAVFVENAQALRAAALPFTRALSGASWEPLELTGVEQMLRANAARVRELLAAFAERFEVEWSLDVVRGSFPGAALATPRGTDLLLLGAVAVRQAPRAARARVVAVAVEAGEAGERALAVAQQLAAALPASLRPVQGGPEMHALAQGMSTADVLVAPRSSFAVLERANLRCTVLLVN